MDAFVGVSYLGSSGSISLDISTLDRSVNHNTNIGHRLTEFTIGSVANPLPIHTEAVPIIQALSGNLWESNERASIQQKRMHLDRALRDYSMNKQAQIVDGKATIYSIVIAT